MRPGGVLAALAGLALAIVVPIGCGGDDAPDEARTAAGRPGVPRTTTTPPLTTAVPAGRAGFLAAADQACAAYRREIGPINRRLARELRRTRRRPGRVAALLDGGAAAASRTVRRIGSLQIPAEDRETIAAYLGTGREAARELRAAADAVRAQDAEAADRHMAGVRLASSRGRTIASRYGFLVCGAENPQAG